MTMRSRIKAHLKRDENTSSGTGYRSIMATAALSGRRSSSLPPTRSMASDGSTTSQLSISSLSLREGDPRLPHHRDSTPSEVSMMSYRSTTTSQSGAAPTRSGSRLRRRSSTSLPADVAAVSLARSTSTSSMQAAAAQRSSGDSVARIKTRVRDDLMLSSSGGASGYRSIMATAAIPPGAATAGRRSNSLPPRRSNSLPPRTSPVAGGPYNARSNSGDSRASGDARGAEGLGPERRDSAPGGDASLAAFARERAREPLPTSPSVAARWGGGSNRALDPGSNGSGGRARPRKTTSLPMRLQEAPPMMMTMTMPQQQQQQPPRSHGMAPDGFVTRYSVSGVQVGASARSSPPSHLT